MAQVFIPTLLQSLTNGVGMLNLAGNTAGEIVAALVKLHPALQPQLLHDGRLRPGVAIAIDGEVAIDGLRESVPPEAEVHFVMAIKGGKLISPHNYDDPPKEGCFLPPCLPYFLKYLGSTEPG